MKQNDVVHIKTTDLCNRCYYGGGNAGCIPKCETCEMAAVNGLCKCIVVQDNTPCPDFMEAEENG